MKNHSIVIGNTALTYGLIIAPMAGVSDSVFRTVCRQHGAEYSVSEMISAKAVHFKDQKTDKLASVHVAEAPCAVQIFGSDPQIMAEAAYDLSRKPRGAILPCAIDINMGCPVKKIVSNGEGSALMRNPKLAGEIVRAVCDASALPVTVKIRTGWSQEEINAVEIAQIAEYNGAKAICVHGRTRSQMYMPPCDFETIRAVKEAVHVPVIGNGDILSGEDAFMMLQNTSCDAVMIGRGALGNPWIFDQIKAYMDHRDWNPPDIDERFCVAREHITDLIAEKGDRIGLFESRKHLAWYVKALPGAAEFRVNVNHCASVDALFALLDQYKNKLLEKR